jgi:hypothetical protein
MLGRFFRASPMFELFRLAPEGERLLSHHARLAGWWDRVSTSASFVRTQVPPRHAS